VGALDGELDGRAGKAVSLLEGRTTFLKLGMKKSDEGSWETRFDPMDRVLSIVRLVIWSGMEEIKLPARKSWKRMDWHDEWNTSGKEVSPLLVKVMAILEVPSLMQMYEVGAAVGLEG